MNPVGIVRYEVRLYATALSTIPMATHHHASESEARETYQRLVLGFGELVSLVRVEVLA